jgi:aminopeptidase N
MFKKVFPIALVLIVLASCKTTQKSSTDTMKTVVLDTMEITVPKEEAYRASSTRENDLLHTKLEVSFDYTKQHLFGKATLLFTPYFYPSSALTLDAKGFDIHKVAVKKQDGSLQDLKYGYDSLQLKIKLDKEYVKGEQFTIYIDYTAKPNELKHGGSDAITDDKGLYFINPKGEDTTKPIQIWTQGETESSSCWFPTIDKPNEKCTDEIYITRDKKYVSLSNGLLISSKDNGNGTFTDYWKMDLPHSPYLFMMAVGNFSIVKDYWRGKEVSYYVEPEYEYMARKIFGNTPEMMEFFSTKLGVDFAWQKYAQVVARDYVSGAMENTSATLHGDFMNRNNRQMLDEDMHSIIAHELFHQWFGDLATCESWSNIPLNESFADYSEYLWDEYKYGNEYADYKKSRGTQKYFNESKFSKNVDLIRYYYNDREDMFDAHSYEKGGAVLHMLRNVVGDDAFFKSLKLYLETNKFKATEIHNLRLAFEEVTGKDMNWFFNQWFLNSGHPVLDINYSSTEDSVFVKVSQKHNVDKHLLYQLPFRIDIHYGNIVVSQKVILNKKAQTFAFKALGKPDLIDADAERVLLCEKHENKTIEEYRFQYENGNNYMQRSEALDSLRAKQKANFMATEVFRNALRDRSAFIRAKAVKAVLLNTQNKDTVLPLLEILAKKDSVSQVRAAALDAITKLNDSTKLGILEFAINDSSYLVASTALTNIQKLDSSKAMAIAKLWEKDKNGDIKTAVSTVYSLSGDSSYYNYFEEKMKIGSGYSKLYMMYHYANFLTRMNDPLVLRGIEKIKESALGDENRYSKQIGQGALERITNAFEKKKQTLTSGVDTKKAPAAEVQKMIARVAQIDEILSKVKDATTALDEKK